MPANLITEWNDLDQSPRPSKEVRIHDETLRDGLQSPSVTQPSIGSKIELLHLMHLIGVDSVDLGMPITSQGLKNDVTRLAEEVAASRLPFSVSCAARTAVPDVAAVADIAHRTGLPIGVLAFVGTSQIRMLVEDWSVTSVLKKVEDAVAFARREGLPVCLVTEDTTRSQPDTAIDVYAAALGAGAERICVCDTVGYATPWGAAACVRHLHTGLGARGFPAVAIDWHGHNDRGLAIANCLAVASAGALQLHGTALGIGERAGNAPMEQLLANLCDLGWRSADLTQLPRYCELAAQICGLDIAGNHPFIGSDAYRTATGVHAAAITKAQDVGGTWLAERVYAGIPASMVGREQTIEVGPGSGRANIRAWLQAHGIAENPLIVAAIQRMVAGSSRVLTHEELLDAAAEARQA